MPAESTATGKRRGSFTREQDPRRNALTHDQIAKDLADFAHAGGKIEVLGITRMLRTIGVTATEPVITASDGAALNEPDVAKQQTEPPQGLRGG